jgi:hypothetical protein
MFIIQQGHGSAAWPTHHPSFLEPVKLTIVDPYQKRRWFHDIDLQYYLKLAHKHMYIKCIYFSFF